MNRTRDRLWIAAALLYASIGVACAENAAKTPAASTAPTAAASGDDEYAAGVNDHHQHHHHGGVTLLVALSVDTLGAPPAQQATLEQISADLRAKMEPARVAEQTVHNLLADGIAAGSIDRAKVDAALAEVTSAAAAVHDATDDTLNQLHAALTPPQRAALVDKVEAHWDVWLRANTEPSTQSPAPHGKRDPLVALASEVGLSQDQVEKIRTQLTAADKAAEPFDPQDVIAHLRSFGNAFRADTFDAKTITSSSAVDARLAKYGTGRMVRFYEAVASVLTPDQRAKVAAILREHANYNARAQGA
ncbi:MAG TPA: periplasmic heavy metal sensor [Polyangiales bacterium]